MNDESFFDQLERLGVGKGPQHLRSQKRSSGPAIETLLAGEVVDSDQGSYFLYQEAYDLAYRHGYHVLSDLLVQDLAGPALLARDERLVGIDVRQMAFVDTETTGLAGGTGTYAFLVGVGVFQESDFVVHQFFMRDFDEEPAQLHALGALFDQLEAVVSFNGKSFDMPLLETRFVMARQMPRLLEAPHLDLLPAARRFWKYRLDSCALSSLERKVLGVGRAEEDVPGWMIPSLYDRYVRSGDAREMPGIFYHNAQDILSLVTLTARMCALLAPTSEADGETPGEDLYGLARLYQDLGWHDRAETAYAQASQSARSPEVREMAKRDLAFLLKRQERRAEALSWWQDLVEVEGAIYACEELAKHYEWHEVDLAQAQAWTQQAIGLVEAWPRSYKRREVLKELLHRHDRLQRKLAVQMSSPGSKTESP
ncbi:MAG: ribonuclease H-like domain-containing protein [Anaerolineae bacterium]|jgi:hypothetical protein